MSVVYEFNNKLHCIRRGDDFCFRLKIQFKIFGNFLRFQQRKKL